MMKYLCNLALLCVLGLGGGVVSAATSSWNLTQDFSVTNGNPNGAWTYGYLGENFTGSFVPFETSSVITPWINSTLPAWYVSGPTGCPVIWQNNKTTNYCGCAPGAVSLHPGPAKEVALVRWTAPAGVSGTASVVGAFSAGDYNANMSLSVRHNGTELWSGTDAGSFSLNVMVSPGDTIDFAVYYLNPSYFEACSTPIDATIEVVPIEETKSWNLAQSFSVSSGNPNGTWTYGYMNANFTGPLVPFTINSAQTPWLGSTLQAWYLNDPSGCPAIWKNTTDATYCGCAVGAVSLHSGPAKEVAIVRWTAPAGISGPGSVVGAFSAGDYNVNMLLSVRHNGTEVWSGTDSGSFNLSVTLIPGDTIDFAVYYADGEFGGCSTPIDATIKLGTTVNTLVETKSGRVDTTANEQGEDIILQNGRVHINGEVYKQIVLSGKVTNWTGYTANDENWSGTWPMINLLGTDYYKNRVVPEIVDETMTSVLSYYGNTNYGDLSRQFGYGANAGVIFWQGVVYGYSSSFCAEDCISGPSGYRADFASNVLTDPSQFEFEAVYDLEALTLAFKLKDVGSQTWVSENISPIGYRNKYGLQAGEAIYDDWSDLVLSIQMRNELTPALSTGTYGFNYTIKVMVRDLKSGDANFDGSVDVGDLGILAANYGKTSGSIWNQGDFNNDGAVDVGDLGILAANYGSSNFSTDYARAFGTTVSENDSTDETSISSCSGLGLPLIAGLGLMGLLLIKLKE